MLPANPNETGAGMEYEVSLQAVAACPTAVVAQATTWQEFPRIWARLLDEVYAFLRDGGAAGGGGAGRVNLQPAAAGALTETERGVAELAAAGKTPGGPGTPHRSLTDRRSSARSPVAGRGVLGHRCLG
jgi:hypothetical protein